MKSLYTSPVHGECERIRMDLDMSVFAGFALVVGAVVLGIYVTEFIKANVAKA